MKIFRYLLLASIILSCKENKYYKPILGEWKLMSEDYDESEPPPPPGFGPKGYCFSNNKTVDTKIGFYKWVNETSGSRRRVYLGSNTIFKIEGDNLEIFNLKDSTWIINKIIKISEDTMVLEKSKNKLQIYYKQHYNIDAYPKFNKIVLSSSGCFGVCPIMNTIIDSSGNVLFVGERYTTKTGFYHAKINSNLFKDLSQNFRKAKILNLKTQYSSGWTDDETIYISFVQDDSIVKTIEDYGHAGPDELEWAFIPVRYLYQNLALCKIPNTNIPYFELNYLSFEKGNKILLLPKSESFLLWNYLRCGKLVNNGFKSRFKLKLARSYIWFPMQGEWNDPYDHNKEILVEKIETDGMYFKFYLKNSKPLCFNIGFNFFDRNYSLNDFKEKGKYD